MKVKWIEDTESEELKTHKDTGKRKRRRNVQLKYVVWAETTLECKRESNQKTWAFLGKSTGPGGEARLTWARSSYWETYDDDDVGGNHLCKGRLASLSMEEIKKSFSSGRSDDVEWKWWKPVSKSCHCCRSSRQQGLAGRGLSPPGSH